MAKIKGPLFSVKAHGAIGPRITFSDRITGPQARFQRKQVDHNTTGQQAERAHFTEAKTAWKTLSAADKLAWHNFNKS